MRRVPVKPTLASPPSSPTATLTRVPLDCRLSPADVLRILAEREPLPFALTGRWAGPPAGAIVGSDPLRVASEGEDPFALLDAVPPIAPAPSGSARSAAAGSGGWATGSPHGWSASRCTPTGRSRSPTFTWPTTTTSCAATPMGGGGSRRSSPTTAAMRSTSGCGTCATCSRRNPGPLPDRRVSPLRLSAHDARHHLDAVARLPPADRRGRDLPGQHLPAAARRDRRPGHRPVRGRAGARRPAPRGRVSHSPRRDRLPVAGAVPAPPRPAHRHRPHQGHDRPGPRPGGGGRRARASARLGQGRRRARDDRRPDAQRPRARLRVRHDRRPAAAHRRAPPGAVAPRLPRPRSPAPGVADGDVLRATFPPGSVTGAPKVQ